MDVYSERRSPEQIDHKLKSLDKLNEVEEARRKREEGLVDINLRPDLEKWRESDFLRKDYDVETLTSGVPRQLGVEKAAPVVLIREVKPGESKAEKQRRAEASEAEAVLISQQNLIESYRQRADNADEVQRPLLLKSLLNAQVKYMHMEEKARQKQDDYQKQTRNPVDAMLDTLEKDKKILRLYADYKAEAGISEADQHMAMEQIQKYAGIVKTDMAGVRLLGKENQVKLDARILDIQEYFEWEDTLKETQQEPVHLDNLNRAAAAQEEAVSGDYADVALTDEETVESTQQMLWAEKMKYEEDLHHRNEDRKAICEVFIDKLVKGAGEAANKQLDNSEERQLLLNRSGEITTDNRDIQQINDFNKRNSTLQIEKSDEPRVHIINEDKIIVTGAVMDEMENQPSNHCWSYAIQCMLRYHMSPEEYRNENISAEKIREHESLDISEDKSGKMQSEMMGIKDEVPTILTDFLPDMALHTVNIKTNNPEIIKAQIKRGLKHGPVSILMDNHYVVITGINGDTVQYKDNIRKHGIAGLWEPEEKVRARVRMQVKEKEWERTKFLARVERAKKNDGGKSENIGAEPSVLYKNALLKVLEDEEKEALISTNRRYLNEADRHTDSNQLLCADIHSFIARDMSADFQMANASLELSWMEKIVTNGKVNDAFIDKYANGKLKEGQDDQVVTLNYSKAVSETRTIENGNYVENYVMPKEISPII